MFYNKDIIIKQTKHMSNKTKIGIVVLILGAFVVGGFAFNAFKVEALNAGKFFFHKFGIDKEEWGAKKAEWKEMTPEERKLKMEELKVLKGEWKAEMKGFKFGHPFGLFKKFGDEINHEAIILDNGIQITITSDNPDIVQKLHDFVGKINNYLAK